MSTTTKKKPVHVVHHKTTPKHEVEVPEVVEPPAPVVEEPKVDPRDARLGAFVRSLSRSSDPQVTETLRSAHPTVGDHVHFVHALLLTLVQKADDGLIAIIGD